MRTFTFKSLFLTVLFVLLGSTAILAADDGLITKQITIKLDKAGTLSGKIGDKKRRQITNLKIVGEINGSDLRIVRDMAGQYISSNLSVLDLSEAKIIKGGSFYYSQNGYYNDKYYYTTDDAIGSYTFYRCRKLKSLKLPSGVTEIGSSAFEDCSDLTSLTIPSGVTEIGSSAFKGCTGLTSLSLPSGITEIGSDAFYSCTGLTSLSLPSGVTEIGSSAFYGCTGLTSLTLPSGIAEIGSLTFYGCTGLTSLTLPSSIIKIGSSAFGDCSDLTSLTLPSGIIEIDSYAFKGCTGLTSLSLPSSITEIDTYAFEGCTGLKDVSFYINGDFETYLTKDHPCIEVGCGIKYYLNDEEITSIVVSSSVTTLGMYAFQRCSNLLSVYVSWPTPISAYKTFSETNLGKCTLYVPQGTEQDYWLANVWGDFGKIVEYDPTGIDKVTTSTDAKELSRYSVNGQRLSAPAKGLNIVKYSDGSVKKVAVQ